VRRPVRPRVGLEQDRGSWEKNPQKKEEKRRENSEPSWWSRKKEEARWGEAPVG